MNYIGKSTSVPTYPIGTASPSIQNCSGVWNLNEVYNKLSGVGTTTQYASIWPQSQTRTLTYRTSTTGSGTTTALTLTHPAGVVAGDLCILFHAAYDTDSDIIITAPSNFSGIQPWLGWLVSGSTNYISQFTSYRILPSTANVTLPLAYDRGFGSLSTSAPVNQAFIALYFYLDQTINHVKKIPFYEFASRSATDPASITNNAGSYAQACPLLVLGSVISNSSTNLGLSATSPAFDGTVTNTAATNIEMAVGYKIYNSAPSDVVIDSDSTGTYQAIQSTLLSVRSL